MVGRRVKQQPHQAVQKDPQYDGGSKFRRKLSNGLALFSLPQRKAVPGRQLSSNASLVVSASNTNGSSTAILEHDALLSLQVESTSLHNTGETVSPPDTTRVDEDIHTPKQLPRPRTFSYIPRAVKVDTEGKSAGEPTAAIELTIDTIMTDAKSLPPSRIPTPSPPQLKRRVSSPRQYLSQHPLSHTKNTVNRRSFVSTKNGSPLKAAVRSRTTPNLLKAENISQTASYMAPRRPGLKRHFASSTPQKPVLAENIPTSKRVAQRHSQIQEKASKRESLAVPSASESRRSFAPGVPLVQSEHASFVAPPVSTKRLSSHITQTPVTAKRVSSKGQEEPPKPESPCSSDEAPLTEPRSRSSESSPTPTLTTIDLTDIPVAPPPRIRDTDHDTQRRTLGTPNGLGGVWRSSKVFAAANHQVRRLPRSSTFHGFGRRETPPLPSIPNYYKMPSSYNLTCTALQQHKLPSLFNLHHHFPMRSGEFGSCSRSLLSEIASAQRSTEAALKSVSTFATVTESEAAEDAKDQQSAADSGETKPSIYTFGNAAQSKGSFTSSQNPTALPPLKAKLHSRLSRRSVSMTRSVRPTGDLQSQRQWSISERFYPDNANNTSCVQVKDYMPPLYWAGRFQSRFDRWRTEAMVAVLNPEIKPEDDGPLGQCGLDDEKKATVLIFMQLRDLCASAQAADSFHVRLY